jgi:uncharacterized membrane protein HdeD (DUF308 family)
MGLINLAAGVLAFLMPGLTALVLLYIIAVAAIAIGVTDIEAAVRLRKVLRGKWALILTGALSIIFGLGVIVFPGAGALAMIVWISAYALVTGALLIVASFDLRKLEHGVRSDLGRPAAVH